LEVSSFSQDFSYFDEECSELYDNYIIYSGFSALGDIHFW